LEQLSPPLIVTFLDHLEEKRGNGIRTRNARLAAIKSFFQFVEYRVPPLLDQVKRTVAIPFKRATVRVVPYLRREEIEAILDVPDITARNGIRDYAMLQLAFATGLRVSELVGVRVDEVDLGATPCIHVRGKGRRERVLPLWKETSVVLRRWCAVRGNVDARELFVNARGEPMTRSGFEYILGKHVSVATKRVPSLKSKRVSPHVLRHSCAMLTLQATGDVRKVALWLGHANIQTTEIYLQTDPKDKLDAVNAITPFKQRGGRFRASDKLIASLKSPSAERRYAPMEHPKPG